MLRFRAISDEELKPIRQSVLDARFSIETYQVGLRHFPKSQDYGLGTVHDEKSLLLAYRFDLGRKHYPLKSPVVKAIVQHALQTGDSHFFVRLGQVLTRPALHLGKTGKPNRLEEFLLSHWAEQRDNLPELCRLTPQGLADVCTHILKPDAAVDDDYSPEALVKVRQRLGLKPYTRQKIQVIRVSRELKFLPVDNK